MPNFRKAFMIMLLPAMFCLGGKQDVVDGFVPDFKNCKKCIVLAEQSLNRIDIVDLDKKRIVWDWRPERDGIASRYIAWFKAPSDAKVVHGGKYILMNASGGAVALLRLSDKKPVFFALAGGNTHSSELLPDGNIVTASSTGNFLKIFRTDTLQSPEQVYSKTIPIEFGHNVVWDKRGKVLWSAARNKLKSFSYNFNKEKPDLILKDSLFLPGNDAHDLFPMYEQNALWISNTTHLFKYYPKRNELKEVHTSFHDIKSISSGPKKYPEIIVVPDGTPKSWWTDEINALDKSVVYKEPGLKIYKARWFLPNTFSY